MGKRAPSILAVDVETFDDTIALHLRVERRLRAAILSGNFGPGVRLPSSRALARDLKVSRHTVDWAFSSLDAAGLIERRRGAGTYVAARIPAREQPPQVEAAHAAQTGHPRLSRRGRAMAAATLKLDTSVPRAFTPSMPSLTLFPQAIWARLMDRAFRRAGPKGWTYSAAVGLDELRSAIAAHVAATRGVNCSAGQIVIVSSSHQAVDLAARVLSDVGERAWMEDPGYPTARYVLQAAGLETVAVPVDADGLDLDQAIARAPDARLAYVTPSHQYPTGALMSLERRRALLDWARRSDGWIIEDDYDGDYCFLNRPLAALHALDPTGRVVYIGTFNKVMFPGLRIAYLIAPDRLVDAFAAAKKLADGFTAIHVQSALADFIEGGHLGEHIRRMLVVYDERRQALFDAARKLDDVLDLQPCEAGLHAPAYLRGKADDRRLSAAGAKRGLDLYPISPYYAEAPRMGFVMGFAAPNPDEIRRGIETFAAILRS